MCKWKSILVVCIFCFLTGCGSNLPENEMVENSQAFEMQKTEEDLQASNFSNRKESSDNRQLKFVTLKEIESEVSELLGENYLPDAEMGPNVLKNNIGLTDDMYVDYLAKMQEAEEQIDTLIIIHAREDKIGLVEMALENYRMSMIQRFENHPLNLAKAEASRMETIEDYVCFVQLGANLSQKTGEKKEALINHCLNENEQALYVIEKAILDY